VIAHAKQKPGLPILRVGLKIVNENLHVWRFGGQFVPRMHKTATPETVIGHLDAGMPRSGQPAIS
jgi:hypothetical protein